MHGIYSHLASLDPTEKARPWCWFAGTLRVPTLWDVVRATGRKAAAISWPVSAAAAIDYNIPEIWDPTTADPHRDFATPGRLTHLNNRQRANSAHTTFCVQAVISPLLSNLYLDPLDHLLAGKGYELVRYADDFVILCRSEAEAREALEQVQAWTASVGLKLHPVKTRTVDATQAGGFDFLGYHFESLGGNTTDWRAGCGRSARPVRREGHRPTGSPYPYPIPNQPCLVGLRQRLFRRLAQNHFLSSPKRGKFSLHSSVPPSLAFYDSLFNGLERNSAP
jgi:hypothetical protein